MRFQQFLNEGFKKIDDREEFIELVREDCKPFLDEFTKAKRDLYRGMSVPSKMLMGTKDVRQDRKPSDATPIQHAFMNKFLETKKLNTRNKVLFTSMSQETVGEYGGGNIFYVFPKGKFKYYFFPHIVDLWQEMDSAFEPITEVHGPESAKCVAKIKKSKNMAGVIDALNIYVQDMAKNEKDYENVWDWFHANLKSSLDQMKSVATGNPTLAYKGEVSVSCKDYYFLSVGQSNRKVEGDIIEELRK